VAWSVLTIMEAVKGGTLHGNKLECADHSCGCRGSRVLAFGGVHSLSRRPQANEAAAFQNHHVIFLYPASEDRQALPAASPDDLAGLSILLVEDSAAIGEAVKQLLELLGACVAGPAASIAEAESLIAQNLPDVALLDFHLRGGERSDGLIARLREQGVPVILLSGSFEFPAPKSLAGMTILEKPVGEAQLIAHLGTLAARAKSGLR
jgi:CheY-like chemotaxis protein